MSATFGLYATPITTCIHYIANTITNTINKNEITFNNILIIGKMNALGKIESI